MATMEIVLPCSNLEDSFRFGNRMEEVVKITGAEYDEMGDIVVLYLSFDDDDESKIEKFLSMQQVITDNIS